MSSKTFVLDEKIKITVYKRRGNRYLRLSIGAGGQVRVSIPAWAPYRAGLEFARARQAWIRDQLVSARPQPLKHGQAIGKAHHLRFVPITSAAAAKSRLAETVITVNHPLSASWDSESVQNVARRACVRALRRQAEELLPQRLGSLADQHGFSYKKVSVKQLKSRWGSCDQYGQIVLNLFLMQLPWELIDYVLLHELTHTRVLRHGTDFWQAMAEVLPDTKARKKQLRNYHPVLRAADIAY